MTLYVRRKRDTDVKNSLLDSVGEGEGGMIWEGSVETCILSYVKWRQGAQGWCTGMTLGDGIVREAGGGVLDGEHMCARGWSMLMYGKNHHNIVKSLASN